MGASLEVTRKNEKNWRWALLTGNFQGVHGGAFLFRKEYSVNHSSLHEPFKGKKKKSSKGMSRGHLPGTTVNWDLVNRGILQTFLKLNPEPHLSACLSARSEALNKYSLKCYVPIKSLLSNRFHPLKRPENSGTLPVWLITHFLQMQNLAVLWNEEGSELRLIIHTFL